MCEQTPVPAPADLVGDGKRLEEELRHTTGFTSGAAPGHGAGGAEGGKQDWAEERWHSDADRTGPQKTPWGALKQSCPAEMPRIRQGGLDLHDPLRRAWEGPSLGRGARGREGVDLEACGVGAGVGADPPQERSRRRRRLSSSRPMLWLESTGQRVGQGR